MTQVATTPTPSLEETKEGPFSQAVEALPDEFADNCDPKGDACCYQGCKE